MGISDAQWLDQQGRVRLVGQLEGDFGGLPTGWTQDDQDPANVSSNDGSLDLGAGELNAGYVGCAALQAHAGGIGVGPTDEISFYGATPTAQQAGVAVTTAAIHAALVNLGLITA